MSVFFNGRLIVTPTTASVIDDSRMYSRGLSVGNVLAIIGTADGGQPNVAMRFASPADARATLMGGELLRATQLAFDPSAETVSPDTIVCIRVGTATQSSLILKDSSASDCIALTSTNYGQFTNQLKVKVEQGTNVGLKLTSQYGSAYYSIDDLQRRAFSIRYSGAAAAATVAISNTALTLVVDGVSTSVALASYPTVQRLVDYLNTLPGIAASVLDSNANKITTNGLDGLAATDCKSASVTVKGDLQAAIDWFNGVSEGYLNATRPPAANKPPVAIPFSYLSGGSNGATTMQDWADALSVLQQEDVQWVVPLHSSPAIHAMTDAHVSYMSNVAGMERRAICGTALGTSDVAAIAAAKIINSDRTSLTHLGVYDYDADGNLELIEPYYGAAIIAAGFSGVNPGTPMTNHSIKVRGLERKLRNPTDTDVLLLGGVLCLEDTRRGFRVVQSISTWLNNQNYNKREQSVGCALDFTMRNVRNALDPLRGRKNSPELMTLAAEITETVLRELARPEPSGPGVLVGDSKSPAYKNITASIVGDQLRVEFQASPVLPCNYILVTCYAVPYSGTITI